LVAVLTVRVTPDAVGVADGVSCVAACAVCATMVRAISSGLISTGASVACAGTSVSAPGMLHARKIKAVTADKNINDFPDDFFFMILLLISMVILII